MALAASGRGLRANPTLSFTARIEGIGTSPSIHVKTSGQAARACTYELALRQHLRHPAAMVKRSIPRRTVAEWF